MPRKVAITFAVSAVEDLEKLRLWYGDQQSPEAGARLISKIFSQIERLADYPESGRSVPEFGIPQLRELIHAPYRIVYRLDKNRVRIVRIWRSERLLKLP